MCIVANEVCAYKQKWCYLEFYCIDFDTARSALNDAVTHTLANT